jgi:hypothetical protein
MARQLHQLVSLGDIEDIEGGSLDDPNAAGRLHGLTDFGDGRYLGVPSHHPLPPTAREEYRISRQEGDGFTFR